jgi:hypothetical protein
MIRDCIISGADSGSARQELPAAPPVAQRQRHRDHSGTRLKSFEDSAP